MMPSSSPAVYVSFNMKLQAASSLYCGTTTRAYIFNNENSILKGNQIKMLHDNLLLTNFAFPFIVNVFIYVLDRCLLSQCLMKQKQNYHLM